MSWIIHVGADIVSEIMFSVAYSDLAVSINDSIEPTIQSIVEIGITKLKCAHIDGRYRCYCFSEQ